jgi:hypothetical protein
MDHSADRHLDGQVAAALAYFRVAAAVAAASGAKLMAKVEIEQGGDVRVSADDDVTAVAAVAAVRIRGARVGRL